MPARSEYLVGHGAIMSIPPTARNQSMNLRMYAVLAAASVCGFAATAALAQDAMTPRSGSSTAMSQDAMSNSSMQQDTMNHDAIRKGNMRKDMMKKEDAMSDSPMHQGAMKHDAMGKHKMMKKDTMKHDSMKHRRSPASSGTSGGPMGSVD